MLHIANYSEFELNLRPLPCPQIKSKPGTRQKNKLPKCWGQWTSPWFMEVTQWDIGWVMKYYIISFFFPIWELTWHACPILMVYLVNCPTLYLAIVTWEQNNPIWVNIHTLVSIHLCVNCASKITKIKLNSSLKCRLGSITSDNWELVCQVSAEK